MQSRSQLAPLNSKDLGPQCAPGPFRNAENSEPDFRLRLGTEVRNITAEVVAEKSEREEA